MPLQWLYAAHRESGAGGVLLDQRHQGQPAAREDVVDDEFEEPQQRHRDRQVAIVEFSLAGRHDAVQQHGAIGGQQLISPREELAVAVITEVLEWADRDDAVHRFVEPFPSLEQYPGRPGAAGCGEQPFDIGLLVAAQCERDDVDVEARLRAQRGSPPPAADIEQRHTRLQTEFVQGQINLGDLGLLQAHVVTLEVGAAVGPGGI